MTEAGPAPFSGVANFCATRLNRVMATVAEQLRQAREAQGLSVHDVAAQTNIRTDHIRALDEGDYSVFPAPAYIRGFVRTYARFLKLDVVRVMEQLNAELIRAGKGDERPSMTSRKRGLLDAFMLWLSKVNWRMTLPALGLALLVAGGVWGYRAWAAYKARNPLEGLKPGVYQPAQRDEGELLPLPAPKP